MRNAVALCCCLLSAAASAQGHKPPVGPWRCWAGLFGERRSWTSDGTTVVLGDKVVWKPPAKYARIDEWCCAHDRDARCWGGLYSQEQCCQGETVLPVRCPSSSASAGLHSPCATLDELGQWFAVTPPPARLGGADKHRHRHDYYRRYERILAELGDDAHMLEIGVAWGNSLAVWGAWFHRGVIQAVDVQLREFRAHQPVLSALGANASGNTWVAQADASSPRFIARLLARRRGRLFDLIVDDSLHTATHQLKLFDALFPTCLAPGGLYIIEDAWQGAALARHFGDFAATHVWLPQVGNTGSDGLQAEGIRRESTDWRDTVVGVSFWRNLVVIKKADL